MKTIVIKTQEELDALPDSFKEYTVIEIRNKKGWISVYRARKNSQVTAYSNSQVTAYDNSQVTACSNSQVTAYDNSQVTACDNSQVTAYDNSQVTAYNNSQVEAFGNSQVKAYSNSQVTAYSDSRVTACDNSQVEAYSNSRVTACDNSQVTACDNSQVTAYNNSQVEACNNSQVKAYSNSQVTAYSDSRVTACDNSQVTAYERATVHASSRLSIITVGDNSTIYKHNEPKELIASNTVNIIDLKDFITPTFEQWLERGYVVADGIRQKLVSQKKIGGVTIYTTKDFFGKTFYVAHIGNKFAHGETVEQAKNDLRYKIEDRDTSKYESWKLDDTKTTEELIEAYRTITGACSTGTKLFCESEKLKDEYTIKEAIELTKGKYNSDVFKEFFNV